MELSKLINEAADTLLTQSAGRLTAEEAARAAEEAARAADAERAYVIHSALSHPSKRGGKARSKVYLSPSTRILFPKIGQQIRVLQKKGQWEKGRCLAYAVEAEIAARRGVRETTFPKTAGLASRDPVKAQLLTALKRRYDVAYQRLRYLRGKTATAGVTLARLRLAWVLREAWGVLLSQPPPVMDETVIPMEGL